MTILPLVAILTLVAILPIVAILPLVAILLPDGYLTLAILLQGVYFDPSGYFATDWLF